MSKFIEKYRVILICLALAFAVRLVYWPVSNYKFINYDDPGYMNSNVQKGISGGNITWAFKTSAMGNWHPLTWLSHILDVQFFGAKAGKHHLVNVFFHLANVLLLFGVLKQMTGKIWQSAFVASLFAFHPLNIESVAWIAERKNVLSTLFWILTIWAYFRYTQKPSIYKYLSALLFFALGLMAKRDVKG